MRAVDSRTTLLPILILAVAVVIATAYFVIPYLVLVSGQLSPGRISSTTRPYLFGPSVSGGKPVITYPPQYNTLANFALAQINRDRAKFNLTAVTLSPIPSGQQHADSMLFFGYFSHWDTQGLKPYTRYSLLNGTGAVEENVAYIATKLPTFGATSSVEDAISRLEYQMMYNDSACCQNGHRENILDPLHNRVSLGIAFNGTRVYLVEDFENFYLSLDQPLIVNGGSIRLDGNSSLKLDSLQLVVYRDGPPQNLTKTQLNAAPYSGAYGAGDFAGGVVPPCLLSCEKYQHGVTVPASAWRVSGENVQVEFRLADFVNAYGSGVYTVYLEQSTGTATKTLVDASFLVGP